MGILLVGPSFYQLLMGNGKLAFATGVRGIKDLRRVVIYEGDKISSIGDVIRRLIPFITN